MVRKSLRTKIHEKINNSEFSVNSNCEIWLNNIWIARLIKAEKPYLICNNEIYTVEEKIKFAESLDELINSKEYVIDIEV